MSPTCLGNPTCPKLRVISHDEGVSDPRFDGVEIPVPRFAADDGSADPVLAEALRLFGKGVGSREQVNIALGAARVLVPMVALLEEAEIGADGILRDKSSSMATVSMVGSDGRRALLAFTSMELMRAFNREARPAPALGAEACRSALEQGDDALLVDCQGPVRFAVTASDLVELASRSST